MGSASDNHEQPNPAEPTGVRELRSFSDPDSASLAKASLEACGIECWLTADDCGGMYPSLQLAEGVKLLVATGQLVAAGQILESKNPVTPDELERLATQAIPEPTPPSRDMSLQLFPLVVGFLLGVVAAWSWRTLERGGTNTYRWDANGDRVPDMVWTYRNGELTKLAKDRNFDRHFDDWYYYSNGLIARAEADNNFDGRVDVWWTYAHDEPAEAKYDTDFNGTPDVTTTFLHGLPTQTNWRPNETNIVTRRQFFQHGVLSEEWWDTNMDGSFDQTNHYDAFEKPIGRNVFRLLSRPSR